MKPLRRLAAACFAMLFPLAGLAQGIRMPADFLPLDVGTRWDYELTNAAGAKAGQISFAVEDYSIIGGASFYVLDEFPFTDEKGDKGERVRFVRYDRADRQFIRKLGKDEGPLFLDNGGSTEVLESDAQGTAQKFLMRTGTMVLTFQRGVGIIEAKLQGPAGVLTAKLARMQSKNLTAAPEPPRLPARDTVPAPAPVTNRRESVTAVISSSNPKMDIGGMVSATGHDITMIVTNTADKLLPFRFGSGQTYDFVITDAAGKEVWRWSRGQFFTQVIRSDSIRPNDKWRFDVVWDHKDKDGNKVPAGQYRLIGIITSLPEVRSTPATLDVR